MVFREPVYFLLHLLHELLIGNRDASVFFLNVQILVRGVFLQKN